MLITATVVISFEVPKDSDELTSFIDHHNMEEWEERIAGPYITYTRISKTYDVQHIGYF